MMRREPVLITTVLCCVAVASSAMAETITWTGAAGNNSWHTAANWDLTRVPGDGDNVVIPDMTPDVNVTYSTGSTTINSLTSAEAFTISAGTLTVEATSSLNSTFALSGGTLTGAGDVTANGAMNWTGSAGMSGTGTTIIAPGGSLTISDTSIKFLSRTLENHSANANWIAGQINFNNGILSNEPDGSFNADLASSPSINTGGTSAINNAGTFNKTGAGTLFIGTPFNNTGALNLDAGAVTLFGGGTNTGTIDAEAGTTLTFSATYAHGGSSSLTGLGTLTFGAGTYDISGTLATNRIINLGGTVNFNAPYRFTGMVILTGTLVGSGDATITVALTWTGSGAMTGTGTSIISPGGSLTISDTSIKFLSRTLENHSANANWIAGQINFNNGVVRNESDGTFNANLASSPSINTGGTSAITNAGTFNKTGAGTLSVFTPFNNTGTVNLDSGAITLFGGGSNGSVIDAGAGTTLTFSGPYLHGGSSSLIGQGTLTFSAGTHTLSGTLHTNRTININTNAVNFDAPYTFTGTVNLTGTLSGSGDATVAGSLNWSGPGAMSGAGRTIIATGGSLTISDTSIKFLSRTVENHSANAVWTAGQINFNNATLRNEVDGTFNAVLDASPTINTGGVCSILNAGIFNKSGTGTLTVNVPFTNTGTLSVQAGIVALAGGLTNATDTTLTGGTYDVAGTLRYPAADVVTNAATIILDGPTSAIRDTAGSNGLAHFATNDATATFQIKNGRNFTLAGVFSNAGQVTIGTGTNTFSASAVTNSGTITQLPVGTGLINAAVSQTASGIIDVQGGTLTLASLTNFAGTTLTGGTYQAAGTLRFGNANIVNLAANVVLDGLSSAIEDTLGTNALTNLASLAPEGVLQIKNNRSLALAGDFSNAGQVTIGPGDCLFALPGTYVQSAGMTTLDGGTIDPADLVDIRGGDLTGNGEVLGNVTNAGMCKPGLSPGSLSIAGDYTQTTAGALEAEIGGTTPGTEYDTLFVGGEATLQGTLRVLLVNGFEPAVGDTFDIVTGGSISPKFATIDLPTLPDLLGLQIRARPAALLLNVIDCGPGDADGDGVGDACETAPDLSWYTIDGGGATFSSGGGFRIGATIGQPDAGVLTGGEFELVGGFWADARLPAPSPGDIDGDGRVDLDDFAFLSDCLGGPGFELGIDCGGADLNGDGTVDLLDFAEFQSIFTAG